MWGDLMNIDALITADVLATIVLGIILFGTLYETKVKDRRRRALAYVILAQIAANIVEILGFRIDHISIEQLKAFLAVSAVESFLLMGLYIHYFCTIAETKGMIIRKHFKYSIIYCVVASIVSIILVYTGAVYEVENGMLIPRAGLTVLYVMIYGQYFILFVYAVRNYKVVGKHDFMAIISYFVLPGAAILLQMYDKELEFTNAAFSISIILIYVMLQSRLYDKNEQQNESYFRSMASMYTSVHILDFESNQFYELGANMVIHSFFDEHRAQLNLQELLNGIMRERICDAHREEIFEFVDLSTLEERMRGKNVVQTEVINVEDHWFRLSFLRINEEGTPFTKVIFATHDIDESRRKESQLILMSNTDELTKLYNRHAFENYVRTMENEGMGDNLWYMCFDLNGLKKANDTQGHMAGDELIIAMARNLSKAIDNYGRAFRIGGDEFVAIIRASEEEKDAILSHLENMSREWKGNYCDVLSYSKGIVCAGEIKGCTILDLEKLADERMYSEKKEYYKKYGRGRLSHRLSL